MATWANTSKDASSFTNQPFGSAGRTWNEATETWNENQGQWDNPFMPFTNQPKSSTSFTNVTKN